MVRIDRLNFNSACLGYGYGSGDGLESPRLAALAGAGHQLLVSKVS